MKIYKYSSFGNLLKYEENLTSKEIKDLIESNNLEGLRVSIDPISNIDKSKLKIFKDTTFLKALSWYVVYYDFDVDFEFLYNYSQLEKLHIQTLSNEVDFSRIPSKIIELDIPFNLEKLKNIKELKTLKKLGSTEFTEKDFSICSNFPDLDSLSLTCKKTKSLKGLSNLSKLVHLGLHGVNCTELGDLESLNKCTVLTISSFKKMRDISSICGLENLKYLEIDGCPNLVDFSSIAKLKNLEVLTIINCKNLSDIQFVRQMPNLKQLSTLGTTIINDCDTTPAEHVPVFFGSQHKKYNKQYPEKEIKEKLITSNTISQLTVLLPY